MILMVISGSSKEMSAQLDEMREVSKQGGGVIYRGIKLKKGDRPVKRVIVPGGYPSALVADLKVEELDPGPSAAEFKRYYGDDAPGFEWGRVCEGAAQLAIALILDSTNNAVLTMKHHKALVEKFVAGWGEEWSLKAVNLKDFVLQRDRYQQGGKKP